MLYKCTFEKKILHQYKSLIDNKGLNMLQLFINNDDSYAKEIIDMKLERLYFVLNIELYKLKNYYRDSNRVIKRPNMLITLLTSMEINILENDISKVTNLIDVDSIYASNKNNIVSNIHTGNILNGVIIPDMNEIFLYTERYNIFDLEDIDILNTSSINVISTTIDTLMLGHPTRYKVNNELEDYTIYEIDVRLLALQYYYWSRDEMYSGNDIDIARFLYTIVFVNLMDSMLNMSLLNRYLNKMNNSLVDKDNKDISNPIAIVDIDNRIDKQIDYLIKNKYKKNRKEDYKRFLKSIHLLDTDAYILLEYHNLIFTNRSEWVYTLARMPYMLKIIEINGKGSLSKNIVYIQNIRYDVRGMKNSKALNRIPDIYFKTYIEDVIKKILTLIA